MKKKKPTFEQFLRTIHGIGWTEYRELDQAQQKALELDYKSRYGAPIVWWD